MRDDDFQTFSDAYERSPMPPSPVRPFEPFSVSPTDGLSRSTDFVKILLLSILSLIILKE